MDAIELLKDPRVVEEIHRYLWIESEKIGYDRGLEWAAEDWLILYGKVWMDDRIFPEEYLIPKALEESPPTKDLKESHQNSIEKKPIPKIKRRPAKSYINF